MTSGSERGSGPPLVRALVCLVVLCAFPKFSLAEPEPEQARKTARSLAEEALELMEQQEYEKAHERLARAYGLFAAPTLAVLDAHALQNMGQLVAAAKRYQQALDSPVDRHSPRAFRKAVKEAKRERARLSEQIPRLVISVSGASAQDLTVQLDDELLAAEDWGKPRQVDPGEHSVRAVRGQATLFFQEVQVGLGETARVVLAVPPSPPTAPPPVVRERRSSNHSVVAWTSLGVGVAGLALGVVSGVVMLNAQSQLDDGCSPVCSPDLQSDLDRFRAARSLSMVGYSVGAVGLGLGLWMIFDQSEPSSEEPKANVGLSQKGAGLRMQGVF